MIRDKLIDKNIGDNKTFRWRSREISRIEGLSDAFFAFAVTSWLCRWKCRRLQRVNGDDARLWGVASAHAALHGLVNQYKFFRRYGLQDALTVCLNAILLFVVLFTFIR